MVEGTDGNDHLFRERVANQYQGEGYIFRPRPLVGGGGVPKLDENEDFFACSSWFQGKKQ